MKRGRPRGVATHEGERSYAHIEGPLYIGDW